MGWFHEKSDNRIPNFHDFINQSNYCDEKNLILLKEYSRKFKLIFSQNMWRVESAALWYLKVSNNQNTILKKSREIAVENINSNDILKNGYAPIVQ